jgi:hypothetical protein
VAHDWNVPTEEFSGDVRLRDRQEDVGLRSGEDVYVRTGAVEGTLSVVDAEYVYTDLPAAGTAQVDGSTLDAAVAAGEDGYVDDVSGDVAVAGGEDVFVQYGAATTLETAGVERVFHDETAAPTRSAEDYDASVNGWNQSREVSDPRAGVSVVGANNEVTVRAVTHDVVVYVTGWGNEVRLEGKNADVTVYFVGRDNRVAVGPYLSVTTAAESGADNATEADPLPPEALVQTSKSDAFADAFVGRHKVTWQEPATDKDWCPNCGADADAVVVRRQRDATFLFSVPVVTHEDGGVSYECEECTPHPVGDVRLTEAERRSSFG